MLQVWFFLLIILSSCAGPKKDILFLNSKPNYQDIILNYSSCSGKGKIISNGKFSGVLSFSFKSQKDSTFLQFTDPLGRKVLLMWITEDSFRARDLMLNEQYNSNQLEKFFPLLKIMKPNDLTKFLWVGQPMYNNKDKKNPAAISENIKIDFSTDKNKSHEMVYNIVDFYDNYTGQKIKIEIKNRKLIAETLDIKKYWKLLKY